MARGLQNTIERNAALEAAARRRAEIAALEAADPAVQKRQRRAARRQALDQWRIVKGRQARGEPVPAALIRSTLRLVDEAEGQKSGAPARYETGGGPVPRR